MKNKLRRIPALILLICMLTPRCFAAAPEPKGKSALLMDAATGTVLFEHNAHEALAPASVTKVMTMLLIMEAIDSGALGWDDTVTASEAAAAKGGSQIYLKVGETMCVSDMLKSIAVSSANDCACAMAEKIAGSEAAFVDRMNERAGELGMADTHFVNCTGLDDGENAAAHRTSAYDIALMSRELLVKHPDIKKYTTIWTDTVRGGAFGLANTNKLIRFYPDATGLKTGYTSAAGYCLSASACREGMELIAVVMGSPSSQDRFDTCKALLDFGFATYALADATPEQCSLPVRLGQAAQVELIPGEDTRLLIEKSQKSGFATEIAMDAQVTAPISRGQRLGTLTVRVGEQILRQIPMVAAATIPRRTTGEIFMELLKSLCMARAAS